MLYLNTASVEDYSTDSLDMELLLDLVYESPS